jgi:hypothetical protein
VKQRKKIEIGLDTNAIQEKSKLSQKRYALNKITVALTQNKGNGEDFFLQIKYTGSATGQIYFQFGNQIRTCRRILWHF